MPGADTAPPELVRVTRDGSVESVHRGHVVLAAADGTVIGALGDADLPVYVRSAAKPFQAVAVLVLLDEAGARLDNDGLAIACASHTGGGEHQIEAARLLALAGLDESALRCPPALPADLDTLCEQEEPVPLAHNCSGKHAAFLLGQTVAGGAAQEYLTPSSRVQRCVREQLALVSGREPTGPGVDGCGAPAWVLPLVGLATATARLADPPGGPEHSLGGRLERVRAAMSARPDLVGGRGCPDTLLMVADQRVVAKRGAEAVFAAGLATSAGPGQGLGVAVKVADGGNRAAAPVVAAVLRELGAVVPAAVVEPAVFAGGSPHGRIAVDPEVAGLTRL
jgi:L-asparaginase II